MNIFCFFYSQDVIISLESSLNSIYSIWSIITCFSIMFDTSSIDNDGINTSWESKEVHVYL